ncbi:tetratricopeptide repeat-containing sensor histidine kinase [Tenacibaculum amylolyticum]|uniref:tetratricopeptide repeat-containing sensor histidine kinase n=1 Tax=Tenacibaculum amylolyticum TaxID=104269 RepID=UPI0038B506FD
MKQFDKAIIYYSEWEKLSSNTDLKSKKNAYHNFALCYIHTRKYNKAKEYFNKGLALIELNDTLTLIKAKMNLANIYYNQYLDDDAIPLFEEAYNLAKSCSDVDLKQYTAQNMAVVERNRKRYKESVTYYREFIKWKDSIWNRDRIWELTEKDKQFAVAQKQQEIIIQEEKLKRQRVVQKGLLFGASGLLVFIGLLGFFYKKLQKKNALITQQKEDLAIANKTKNYLFSVVSHDLRSPMNTIKHQHQQLKKHIANHNIKGIEEANNTAITVTESTSHLLNNVLHWSLEQSNQMVFSQKEYPLQPIIKHVLHGYENLVEANDVSITTNFHENALVSVDRESIKIVLRNILDNAVKYMNGKGKITIASGIDSENYAYISIQDTGIGITEERLEKINALKGVSIDKINRSEGVGLGLILCQTLVKKNQGILSFESVVNEGTNVIIQLPISNQ